MENTIEVVGAMGGNSVRAKACHYCARMAAIVVGAALLLSAIYHLTNSYHFLGAVYEYELVGPRVGVAVAITMPALQLLTAVCLLSQILVRAAFLISTAMLAMFCVLQWSVIQRHLDISCGCWGPSHTDPISVSSMSIVVVLLCLSVSGLLCDWLGMVRQSASSSI
jgi:hypothetical protein